MQVAVDKTPIDVVAALAGSSYKDVSEDLAKEFANAQITVKGTVHNAPLKVKKTFGVDIYEVMRLIIAYEGPPQAAPKKTKKSS